MFYIFKEFQKYRIKNWTIFLGGGEKGNRINFKINLPLKLKVHKSNLSLKCKHINLSFLIYFSRRETFHLPFYHRHDGTKYITYIEGHSGCQAVLKMHDSHPNK